MSKKEPSNLMEYIQAELKGLGDSWDNVVTIWIEQGYGEDAKKITKAEAIPIFKREPAGSGHGGTDCTAFHIYTKKTILFMACYDGSEWIESIPCNVEEKRDVHHVGGG